MLISRDPQTPNTIRAWGPGELRIRDEVIRNNVILTAERIIHPWAARDAAQLTMAQLAPALDLEPAILILGTGPTLVFPDAEVRGGIMSRGIGLEVMDTPAACRTFNVLVAERRNVAAALLIEALRAPD